MKLDMELLVAALFARFSFCGGASLVTTSLAGISDSPGLIDAFRTRASFSHPSGLKFDSRTGSIYVADENNQMIRVIDKFGYVTKYAGTGFNDFLDGPRLDAKFSYPNDLELDLDGNLYVADWGNGCIRKISSGVVTTFSGKCKSNSVYVDGLAALARFINPSGLYFSKKEQNLYVTDTGAHTVRKITMVDGTVVTLAGIPGIKGFLDGPVAKFSNPYGLVQDEDSGLIFVADHDNQKIRRINQTG